MRPKREHEPARSCQPLLTRIGENADRSDQPSADRMLEDGMLEPHHRRSSAGMCQMSQVADPVQDDSLADS